MCDAGTIGVRHCVISLTKVLETMCYLRQVVNACLLLAPSG